MFFGRFLTQSRVLRSVVAAASAGLVRFFIVCCGLMGTVVAEATGKLLAWFENDARQSRIEAKTVAITNNRATDRRPVDSRINDPKLPGKEMELNPRH